MAGAHAHSTTLARGRPQRRPHGLTPLVQGGAALLALLVTFAFTAVILSARQQRADARAVARSAETVAQIERLQQLLLDLETGVRGYVITGEEPFLAPYFNARQRFGPEAAQLVALVGDRARPLERDGRAYASEWADDLIALERRAGRQAVDLVITQEGKQRMDALRAQLDGLRATEQRRGAEQRATADRNATRAIAFGAIGLAGSLVLLFALVRFLQRRVTTPIERVADAARRLEAGETNVRVEEDGPCEVVQLAHSFNRMSHGLQRRGENKNDFLSRMSHELRTPLNAVLGFGQLLQLDPTLRESQREHVVHIVRGGRHLLELINEVLDISRIESGSLSLSPESVDVGEAIRDAVALVRPLAEEREIALHADGASGFVIADHQRFKQVLLNLLSNAIKYNRHAGSVHVACRTANGVVSIEVADTGPGIPADRLGRLFEPFDRLGAERSGIEGTGLGLALSRSLVEVMGGTLTAANRGGAVFTVTLPEGEELAAPVVVDTIAAPVVEASRILYIEDNAANFRLVRELLTIQRPVEIIPAILGRLGVDLAREHLPDLILLDLHLPDMEGTVVLAQLKADPATADIPVLIVTADATPGRERRLVSDGAVACVTKPFDVPVFLRAVESALAS